MIVSILEAISRTTDNGLQKTNYYLFLKASTTGQISIETFPKCNSEIIYGNIHDFLKDWQNIICHGYANNEYDLKAVFAEITG